ncbi:MAG: P-II family nitrogen regulator [Anaerolineaceae bacterium]|nr:P-II family nitrogen regulator [Anaerolineaceae bacterium]MDE0329488.1 P-II family nitrogen regulator [Anaerolineaceae bacterium]MDE0610152.1 P-II family nitrogen regulator [Anaerolineaceae bacterium]
MIKKIEAIVRTEKLSSTIRELSAIGIVGMTVQPVKGRGRGVGMQLRWRGALYNVDLLPRTMVTLIVSETNVDETVQAVMRGAATGEHGDGVIFVSPVEHIIRISSGETDREAISYQGDIDARKQQRA